VGYGAGSKDFKDVANVLRIVIEEPLDHGLLRDEVCVLETNLDDVTGKVLGYTMDRLLGESVRDVSVIPMFTKKNRPGYIVKVIVDKDDVERISRILMEETGTLSVRVIPCSRHILAREIISVEIDTELGKETVRLKVAKDSREKFFK